MGYTHYFPQTRAFTDAEWSSLKKLAEIILAADDVAGPLGEGKPVINDTTIAFNGVAADEDDYETFSITKAHNSQFNFCKTAQRGYDKYVTAILFCVHNIAPNALDIGSDGDARDWEEGTLIARMAAKKALMKSLDNTPRLTK